MRTRRFSNNGGDFAVLLSGVPRVVILMSAGFYFGYEERGKKGQQCRHLRGDYSLKPDVLMKTYVWKTACMFFYTVTVIITTNAGITSCSEHFSFLHGQLVNNDQIKQQQHENLAPAII
jgi:hypothetical protein